MAALGPFGVGNPVAVAVSGGADSMALAVLLAGWGQPTALIVDHGLRPEAKAEASVTAGRLAALGIAARVLDLGLTRGPALAERARAARYIALGDACRDAGLTDLLVAHHAQDQAETLLIRRQAGSGPGGLACMATVTHADAVRLLRPLLSIMPARLRASLREAGVEWVEDPSNSNLATPRARLRAAFRDGTGPTIPELCCEARRFGVERHAREAAVAAELAQNAELLPSGVAVVAGPKLSVAALSALIWTVSGARHPPARASVAHLDGQLRPATLHGAAILPTRDGWLIGREAAAQAADEPAQAGTRWDGRFRLLAPALEGSTIGPLGADAGRLRRWSDLPAALLRTLPAIRCNHVLFAVPHLAYPDRETCQSLPLLFCPSRPVVPAPFAVDRLGGDVQVA
jgi:tRNA(Ile)-lysidine synthase